MTFVVVKKSFVICVVELFVTVACNFLVGSDISLMVFF